MSSENTTQEQLRDKEAFRLYRKKYSELCPIRKKVVDTLLLSRNK